MGDNGWEIMDGFTGLYKYNGVKVEKDIECSKI